MNGRTWSGWTAALLAGAVLGLAAPRAARAQGFGVYEQGTCAMGRAGAAVARPCDDGSAMFYNPAALVAPAGRAGIAGGATFITAGGRFTADDGTTTDLANDNPAIAPHAWLRYGLNDRTTIGVGFYAPYGLETKWPTSFEGRFVGYDNKLHSFYVQPTLAWRPNDRFAIGGGPTVVIGSVELNRRLDLSHQPVTAEGIPAGTTFGDFGIPPGTDFADSRLKADGATGVGAHVGVTARLGDRAWVGGRYLSKVTLDYDGTATFTQISTGIPLPPGNPLGVPGGTPIDAVLQAGFAAGGPLVDGPVHTSIDMPAQWVGGLAVQATDRLLVEGDLQWTRWSAFDRVVLEFDNPATPNQVLVENYDDTATWRVGADLLVGGAILRGGYIHNDAAAPPETVTPLLPEGKRNHVTAGLTWPVGQGVTLDLAYQYLSQADRRGRVVGPPAGTAPTTNLNSGTYGFHSHLLGATLRVDL